MPKLQPKKFSLNDICHKVMLQKLQNASMVNYNIKKGK